MIRIFIYFYLIPIFLFIVLTLQFAVIMENFFLEFILVSVLVLYYTTFAVVTRNKTRMAIAFLLIAMTVVYTYAYVPGCGWDFVCHTP